MSRFVVQFLSFKMVKALIHPLPLFKFIFNSGFNFKSRECEASKRRVLFAARESIAAQLARLVFKSASERQVNGADAQQSQNGQRGQ